MTGGNRQAGFEPAAGLMSLSIVVPDSVPFDFHSSIP